MGRLELGLACCHPGGMYFDAAFSYFRQVCCAAWNRGECGFRPFGGATDTPWAFTTGSGKTWACSGYRRSLGISRGI